MTLATRVGVLTFLHNDNYGSALQAYALQWALTALGAEAEHLDYRPSRQEKLRNLLTSGNSPRLILEGMRKRSVRAPGGGRTAEGSLLRAVLCGAYADVACLRRSCGIEKTGVAV